VYKYLSEIQMAKSAWLKHVMSVKNKNPHMSLGDAMKMAKKTYKKGGSDDMGGEVVEMNEAQNGGQLMGKGTVAGGQRVGGKRRKTRKAGRKMKGGQLYTQAGGPYTGSVLSDGAAPFKPYDLSSMQFPGANPAAMTGARRRKTRRHTRKHRA
jgi:hypothetical protein